MAKLNINDPDYDKKVADFKAGWRRIAKDANEGGLSRLGKTPAPSGSSRVARKPKPAASLNTSGNSSSPGSGNFWPPEDSGSSTSAPDFTVRHGPVPQTRSPAANVNPAQFNGSATKRDAGYTGKRVAPQGKPAAVNAGYEGKRRAPQGKHVAPSSDTGYRGSHAKGSHAKDYDFQSDLDKSRAKKQHVGSHSARAPKPIGKHGKPYNPEADIKRDIASKGKAPYVPKHTPEGQGQRATALRQKANQERLDKTHSKLKKAHVALHNFKKLAGGKHYSEHLRAMETKI